MLNLCAIFNNSKLILFFNKYNYLFCATNYILSLYIANIDIASIINISTKKKSKV